jgi:hypothetical protein
MFTVALGAWSPRRAWPIVGLCAWAVAVSAYWGWLATYSYTPGTQQAPPDLRRVSLPLARHGDGYTLLLAVHPQCPCSRASIAELARLASRFRDRLTCILFVYFPRGQTDDWLTTSAIEMARQLPQTQLKIDVDGRRARQFGMNTSGATILYSPQGELEFWGGITPSRGHQGDNIGADAIAAVLVGKQPLHRSVPVYGCKILSESGANDR